MLVSFFEVTYLLPKLNFGNDRMRLPFLLDTLFAFAVFMVLSNTDVFKEISFIFALEFWKVFMNSCIQIKWY